MNENFFNLKIKSLFQEGKIIINLALTDEQLLLLPRSYDSSKITADKILEVLKDMVMNKLEKK
jgi:hypothetical protein